MFERGKKVGEREPYFFDKGGISVGQAGIVGLGCIIPRITAPLIDGFLASATES